MKNIMIIDGAENCTYEIFSIPDEEYFLIFDEREVYFIEDIVNSEFYAKNQDLVDDIFKKLWKNGVDRKSVVGIDATLFYEQYFKKEYFESGYWYDWRYKPSSKSE